MKNKELVLEARNRAGNYYKQGYNCAEAILMTCRELLAPELDPQIVKMATPLGGGIGRTGCLCGALNASIMGLGMLQGRTDCQTDRSNAGQHAANIHKLFTEQFGSPCCSELNFNDFDNVNHYRRCLKIVGGTAFLLFTYFQNQGWLPEESHV